MKYEKSHLQFNLVYHISLIISLSKDNMQCMLKGFWVFHQIITVLVSNIFFARENRIERKWYTHAIWNVTKLFENNNCIIIVDSEKGGEKLYDYPELCLSLFCWFDSIYEFVWLSNKSHNCFCTSGM